MASRRKTKLHFLAEWRAYRKMTLRQLASSMETDDPLSATSLNRIEKHTQPLTPPVLYALADVLKCAPEDIIGINPIKRPELVAFAEAARRVTGTGAPPEQIERAAAVLRAMTGAR